MGGRARQRSLPPPDTRPGYHPAGDFDHATRGFPRDSACSGDRSETSCTGDVLLKIPPGVPTIGQRPCASGCNRSVTMKSSSIQPVHEPMIP